ncbi:glycosyltransferase family 4 protein [Candidatus Woesearchaeota archaeon]|nr:glycosyltransferase family 4 protein [Candidatus Woesearchaeota archaeon]
MKFVEIVPEYPMRLGMNEKEDYFYWPAKLMMDKGYKVEFFTLKKKNKPSKEVFNNITVRRFSSPLSLLVHLFFQRGVKLIHAHLRPFTPSLFAALLFNKRRIITPHSYILGSSRLIAELSIFLFKRFDKIIALTPYEKGIYLKKGIPSDKVFLLPHPVDYEFYSKKISGKETVRKKWKINKNTFVVISVANIRKFKRMETLLNAFKIFNAEVINSKLIIVGEDQLYKERAPSLNDMIEQFGVKNVILTGFQSHNSVRSILNISDVFVNTSDNETQCLAVYEAACVPVPLCLSEIGSFTGIFRDSALYHKYYDFEKLAANLSSYYNDTKLRKKNSQSAKKLMRLWNFSAIKKKMEKLYDEVMAL